MDTTSSSTSATSSRDLSAPSPPKPVGPAWVPRVLMRPMIKKLNPIINRRAGRAGFELAAQIRHVGRRSGRAYVTPVTVRRLDSDTVMIGLTYGNQSDWARNVMAAGGCELRMDGRDYHATSPRLVDLADAGPAFRSVYTRFQRTVIRRVLGISQFMQLTVTPAG